VATKRIAPRICHREDCDDEEDRKVNLSLRGASRRSDPGGAGAEIAALTVLARDDRWL
jgi:hypothetical protein